MIQFLGADILDGSGVLNGVTEAIVNKGHLNILDSATVAIKGKIDNIGKITLGSGVSTLAIDNGQAATLYGGGTIDLGSNVNNQLLGFKGATLTNVDNTIVGAGSIVSYNGQGFNLINKAHGIIDASDDNLGLTLNTGATLANAGKLEATDDAVLFFSAQTVQDSAKGEILASGQGSTVELYQSTIEGGILATATGGLITTADGSTTDLLDGTKIAVDITGSVVIEATSSLNLDGAIKNSGSITLQAFSNETAILAFAAGTKTTLSGSGKILLTQEAYNEILGSTGATLTNDGNTISGAGVIEGVSGDAFTLINGKGGVIDSTFAGRLIIDKSVTLTNNGILEANGGLLRVDDAVTGTGVVEIGGEGTAFFAGAFNEDTTFLGAGALQIEGDAGGLYKGTVTGFGANDTIFLEGLVGAGGVGDLQAKFVENSKKTGGVLDVFDTSSNTDIYALKMTGNYSSGNFSFQVVNNSGTAILYQAI